MTNLTLGKEQSKNKLGFENLKSGLRLFTKLKSPDETVTIYFPGYVLELEKGDPSIPYEQEQAKIARFYEATLATVSVDSMANAAKEIFGEDLDNTGNIVLPAEIEHALSSWLSVSNDQSSESLSSGAVKELLGDTDAYKSKLRNISWKAEAIKNHPVLNMSQESKDYLEEKSIDLSLITSPDFLASNSEKDLKQLLGSLNKYQEELRLNS